MRILNVKIVMISKVPRTCQSNACMYLFDQVPVCNDPYRTEHSSNLHKTDGHPKI